MRPLGLPRTSPITRLAAALVAGLIRQLLAHTPPTRVLVAIDEMPGGHGRRSASERITDRSGDCARDRCRRAHREDNNPGWRYCEVAARGGCKPIPLPSCITAAGKT